MTGKRKLLRFLAFAGLTLLFSTGFLILRDRHLKSPRHERLAVSQQQIAYKLSLLNRDLNEYEASLQNLAFNDDHIYRVYFEVGNSMAYVSDLKSHDARTEGLSYGMMIAVQFNKKDVFDRLWRWQKNTCNIREVPVMGTSRGQLILRRENTIQKERLQTVSCIL